MMTKKLTAFGVALFAAALSLAACGEPESAKTAQPNIVNTTEQDTTETVEQETTETVYERKAHEQEDSATFTHVGDKILKQQAVHVYSYEASGFRNEEEARAALGSRLAELNAIDGYQHNIEFGDTHITEEIIAHYAAMDPADVVKLPGMDALDTTEDAAFYSLEQTVAGLEANGYIKVE